MRLFKLLVRFVSILTKVSLFYSHYMYYQNSAYHAFYQNSAYHAFYQNSAFVRFYAFIKRLFQLLVRFVRILTEVSLFYSHYMYYQNSAYHAFYQNSAYHAFYQNSAFVRFYAFIKRLFQLLVRFVRILTEVSLFYSHYMYYQNSAYYAFYQNSAYCALLRAFISTFGLFLCILPNVVL